MRPPLVAFLLIPCAAFAQAPDPLAITLPTGKTLHFLTVEKRDEYLATTWKASGHEAVFPSPSPQFGPLHGLRVVDDGVSQLLLLSNGKHALRAFQAAALYDDPAIAADPLLLGKPVAVFGSICEVGTDVLGEPCLVLDANKLGLGGVRCCFTKSAVENLTGLQKGSFVCVVGKRAEKLIQVQMIHCELIPWGGDARDPINRGAP